MAAPTTNDQFLDVLRKSRLVDEARLDAFLGHVGAARPETPRLFAERLVRQGFLTPFQASQLLTGKWRGFVIGGKYRLLELLGRGGMGTVYLCEHLRMRRLVAIKILPADRIQNPSSLERFDREARASAALDHPNIVRAHDVDQDEELHFLVMEYVDGSSLYEIVKRHGPMDVTRACHYVRQAAEGLQHAHEAGWVHRDVKPGNLLLDRSGTIKILDLGLARFFSDGELNPLTQKYERNAVLGTADYVAPEQTVNSSDVYSLGCTFYFLLTGRPPFEGGSAAEKLVAHQTRQPEPVRKFRPEVPKELEAVILKMMARKPSLRYQQLAEVVAALARWTGAPIPPPSEEEMPRRCPALELCAVAGPPSSSTALPGLSGRHGRGPRSGSHSGSHAALARARAVAERRRPLRLLGAVLVGLLLFAAGAAAALWWSNTNAATDAIPGR
jgi:serine/threonine protein kinase